MNPTRTALLASGPGDRFALSMAARGRKSRYESVKFIAPNGTRDFYRKAAELAGGLDLRTWMRETLHREALRLHEEHRVKGKAPGIHPKPPPPLQER